MMKWFDGVWLRDFSWEDESVSHEVIGFGSVIGSRSQELFLRTVTVHNG